MDDLGIDRSILSDFITNSAEAICVLDESKHVVDWNMPLNRVVGIKAGQAIGKSFFELLPDFNHKSFNHGFARALNGNGNFCERLFRLSRVEKHVKVSFSPIRLHSDNDLVMVIIRQVVREWVNTSESRFKPLIEESPIATAIFNPCGKPRYFNKAYGAIWGAKEGVGQRAITTYNILEDEQLVELGVKPFIQKAFEGETSKIPPIPYTPSNTHTISDLELDEQKYVKGHIFPIKDKKGELEEVVLILTDVTFQKKAEQILTDTHLKFQMLTVGLPGVIYEYQVNDNGSSKFKYISEGCEAMFGVSPEEALKDDDLLLNTIHPDDYDSFVSSSKNSDKAFTGWSWEGRIVVNGETKWIEGKSSPARTSKGNIVRYGLLLDITDKKNVEEQYRLTEERLKLALQGAELGLWEWGEQKRKTLFNSSWAKKFGYDPEELEEKLADWKMLVHPDDLEEVERQFEDHLAGKSEFYEAEYRFRTKEGNYRWVLDKGKPIDKDENGRIKKVAGTYLDINDKKSSELLIKRNEKLFTQLFDNSPLGIVMLDGEHKVMQMNQGFQNIFGYSKSEIIGNQLNDIIVPAALTQEAMDINTLTTSGQVGMLESFRLSKDGKQVPVLIYGVPVQLDNETIGIYGIYVDITDRKKAEDELQVRNNELDHFVYKVSHDLRAPLSSILGLVHLANHEQNEDDIREYIAIIESRVKQLDNFINDVLSHSKNLKLALTVEKIDLESIIEKCFSDLSYLPKASAVNQIITIDNHDFYSDRWRINEIFRNLISNAIKYLNPDIDNPYVKINIDITDEKAVILLEDNGIGIEEDTLPKVFEMFYRATEHSEGSGIGLYIVKNALEKLGGDIQIKSAPFVGTTFRLEIPNNKEGIID